MSDHEATVCVLGLGFVGAAMSIAVALARGADGKPSFAVTGIDLPTDIGRQRIDEMNAGRFPFETADDEIPAAMREVTGNGNFVATADPQAIADADVIVVDIHLDIPTDTHKPEVAFDDFRAAIATIARHMSPGALVMVETTVPPGTCEKVVAPELAQGLAARGLPADSFLLAHSYERVMPGPGYLASAINFWRVYAGHTLAAAERCEWFLGRVMNVQDYPLRRLASTTASETAKVLENSYRAVNIAFIDEWRQFAESAGIDLFQVIEAIRDRPTHANIRSPGFGVGGYCLTKDPLFAQAAATAHFDNHDLEFPFCHMAVRTNRDMPLRNLSRLESELGGSLDGKRLLLLGVSYRSGVDDTRFSPSEIFIRAARERGANVIVHDPMVEHWQELDEPILSELPDPSTFDALVLAVAHEPYQRIELATWLGGAKPLIFDGNDVLTGAQRQQTAALGCRLVSAGRGNPQGVVAE
jgi:UDP-N-acetyl-D-glucosamine dehydrogenase